MRINRVLVAVAMLVAVGAATETRTAEARRVCYSAYDFKKEIMFWPDSWKHNGSGNSPDPDYAHVLTTTWIESVHQLTYDGQAADHEQNPCGGNG